MPQLGAMAAALCLAAACSGHPAPAASTPAVNSLTVKACTVAGQPARCGTLIVPEDRLTGTGRTIAVRLVVIPATGPDRVPDPVVWFSGGPGGSAVDDIRAEMPLLAGLNGHRDLVFVEQRGTGSSNPLNCPVFSGSLADQPVMRASIQSCLAHLPGDLRFYTTAMYVDDVNQLLGDLHYATANFVGGSYGTDAEQVFLLRHPARVRTMTLISGSPLNIRLFDFWPGNSQLALDYVLAQCQSQPRLPAGVPAPGCRLGRPVGLGRQVPRGPPGRAVTHQDHRAPGPGRARRPAVTAASVQAHGEHLHRRLLPLSPRQARATGPCSRRHESSRPHASRAAGAAAPGSTAAPLGIRTDHRSVTEVPPAVT